MRFNPTFKVMSWILVFAFFMAGTAQSYAISRVIPSGKIMVYQNGKLVQVLKEEAPLPTGKTLVAKGDCGVRMNKLYIVAKDGCAFSVLEDDAVAQLKIEKGLLFFAANHLISQMVFETPSGVVSTQQIIIQASATEGMLKGYVDVSDGTTKIGVLEGGMMMLSTPQGDQAVSTGHQIVLAQAELIKPKEAKESDTQDHNKKAAAVPPQSSEQTPPPQKSGKIPGTYFVAGGAILLGAGIAAAVASGGGGGGGGGGGAPASPAAP